VPRFSNSRRPVLNLTLIIGILIMLAYIISTEMNTRRYRRIMDEIP
jgi:hypothetical protein